MSDNLKNKKYFGPANHEYLMGKCAEELHDNWILFLAFMHAVDEKCNTKLVEIFSHATEVSMNFNTNREKIHVVIKVILTIDLGSELKYLKEELEQFIKEHFESISIKLPYQEIKLEFMGKYQNKTKFSVHNL
jgi:hypothetical protein